MGVTRAFSRPGIFTLIGVVTSMLLIRRGVLGAAVSPLEPGCWPPGKGEVSPGPVVP